MFFPKLMADLPGFEDNGFEIGDDLRLYHNRSFQTGDGLCLYLWQRKESSGPPVLLLHGASAGHQTFMIPKPHGQEGRSLADWLYEQGYEPWLLDWRGSMNYTFEKTRGRDGEELFTFDQVAQYDIPQALDQIRQQRGKKIPIGAVGWCMGSGSLAQAIAQDFVSKEIGGLTHVVLMTIGLFYESPVDSRLKAEERLLEALLNVPEPPQDDSKPPQDDSKSPQDDPKPLPFVDPRVNKLRQSSSWPQTIHDLYRAWPERLKPHEQSSEFKGDDLGFKKWQVLEMCNRLSFMYGMIYAEKNLVLEVHATGWEISFDSGTKEPSVGNEITGSNATGTLAYSLPLESGAWEENDAAGRLMLTHVKGDFTKGESLKVKGEIIGTAISAEEKIPAELLGQFGRIPTSMYLHAAQNIRRRWAGTYSSQKTDMESQLINNKVRQRFTDRGNFEQITLIGGSLNRLWHRESIDRMYEWLLQGNPSDRNKYRKVIFPNYGHQDLMWGKNAYKEVFPKIMEGLPPVGKKA